METDKISTLLEKQLKTLGQKVRLDILKTLSLTKHTLTFSELQAQITQEPHSINLSYHLNNLKEAELVNYNTQEQGYYITSLGRKILKNILSIETILSTMQEKRVVRTSKYNTEPFDIRKIKSNLMREANFDEFLAEKISKKVEKKLLQTEIKYLTTQLIREYVNAILLEEGLEEASHKLTRLGVPPYDTRMIFYNEEITPHQFITSLGSEVSKQFLLLNLLPSELSDLYLSGKIVLLDLNYWAMKPLGIAVNINNSFETTELPFTEMQSTIPSCIHQFFKKVHIITNLINNLEAYFSNQVFIINLDELFSPLKKSHELFKISMNLLCSQLSLLFNNINSELRCSLWLNPHYFYSSHLSVVKEYSDVIRNIMIFLEKNSTNKSNSPLLLIDYRQFSNKEEMISFLSHFKKKFLRRFIFFKGPSNLIDSCFNRYNIVENENENEDKNENENGNRNGRGSKVLLDKILVNLYDIALEANQCDETFFEILNARLNHIFELFSLKEQFVRQRLNNSFEKNKNFQIPSFLNSDVLLKETIKSISFIGLNEAITFHCGIELDRIKDSQDFAIRIMKFIQKIINKKNNMEQESYCLTQPHCGQYLNYFTPKKLHREIPAHDFHKYRLIRQDSNLTLPEKMGLYKKFSEILTGGSLFEVPFNNGHSTQMEDIIDYIWKFELNAFKFAL